MPDIVPIDPREDTDGPETFVTFSRRYQSPDKTDYSDPVGFLLSLADEIHPFFSEFWHYGDSTDELKEKQLRAILDKHYLIQEVTCNEYFGEFHADTGYSVDTAAYGYIVLSQTIIDQEWTGDRDTASRYLYAVVETYSTWATGNVWGFVVERKETCDSCDKATWKEIESCRGFYGTDWRANGLAEYLEEYKYLLDTLDER